MPGTAQFKCEVVLFQVTSSSLGPSPNFVESIIVRICGRRVVVKSFVPTRHLTARVWTSINAGYYSEDWGGDLRLGTEEEGHGMNGKGKVCLQMPLLAGSPSVSPPILVNAGGAAKL
jgi:hypothetical protein